MRFKWYLYRSMTDQIGRKRPAGHRLLDFPGWDAQAGGSIGLIVGDQRSRHIVAVSRPFLGRMGWRHPIAVAIEQHAGEQARRARACAGVAPGGIGGELPLDRIPQRLIDDRRVFAAMGLPLVHDLAAIEVVLQDVIQRTAREWLANAATRSARPRLAFDPPSFELVLQ